MANTRPRQSAAAAGRRGVLSVDRIVSCALDITRDGHLSEASTLRLAAELGVTPMALYRYIGNKEHLLELVLDAAHAEIELPSRGNGDWTEQLKALAHDMRALYRLYPGLAEFAQRHHPVVLSHHGARIADWCMQSMLDAGLTVQETSVVFAATRELFFIGLSRPSTAGVGKDSSDSVSSADLGEFEMLEGEFPALAAVAPLMSEISADDEYELLVGLLFNELRRISASRATQGNRRKPRRQSG